MILGLKQEQEHQEVGRISSLLHYLIQERLYCLFVIAIQEDRWVQQDDRVSYLVVWSVGELFEVFH